MDFSLWRNQKVGRIRVPISEQVSHDLLVHRLVPVHHQLQIGPIENFQVWHKIAAQPALLTDRLHGLIDPNSSQRELIHQQMRSQNLAFVLLVGAGVSLILTT